MDTQTLADKLGLTDDDFENALTWGTTANGTDSTRFTAKYGHTIVRGGGHGADSYVAQIVGTDPQWGFKREFVDALRTLSGTGGSGTVSWDFDGSDGLYNYGRVTVSSTHVRSGFFLVLDGKIADLGNKRATLLKALTALEEDEKTAVAA